MTHNQLPPTEQQTTQLPHEHVPERLRNIFEPGNPATAPFLHSLTIGDEEAGENELLNRYEDEPTEAEVLNDVCGLIKAVGCEDSLTWDVDCRDAAVEAIRILATRFHKMPRLPLDTRMQLITTYVETMRALPDESDLSGAGFSLLEVAKPLGRIVGKTGDKQLSNDVAGAVMFEWHRLQGADVVKDPEAQTVARSLLQYDPEGDLLNDELPSSKIAPEQQSAETPASAETINQLITELRVYLYGCGNEEAVLAARRGDLEQTLSSYVASTAPQMQACLGGRDDFLQHRFKMQDAPGFYAAVAESFQKEWELQETIGAPELEDQDNINARLNNERDTSQYKALNLFDIRELYSLNIDPYDFLEGQQEIIIAQARQYDAFVDRLCVLQDLLRLTPDEILRVIT